MSVSGLQSFSSLFRRTSVLSGLRNVCQQRFSFFCQQTRSSLWSKVTRLGGKNPARMATLSQPSSQIDNDQNGKKITVCIEGNIGSGKTMLLDHFASQTDDVQVIPEPVNMWRNVQGHNMLGLMYEDPVKCSFAFQSYVQLSMLTTHTIPHTHPLKMMERSIFSAKYCFVENLYRGGLMSDAEYAVITEWFNWIVSTRVKVDQIIYLRTTPENCLRNVQERHRDEESSVSLEYLNQLDQLHEDWLIHKKFPLPAPVMVIDANRPITEMLQYYKDHRKDILTPRQQAQMAEGQTAVTFDLIP